ncbi:DinB family protein [Paenisporosarcina quisquiliarum]|uniref:DinB family protein n=1 Tax=Paenisporosarcina quisquiliarum TaxID=365346 RepID=UPI003734E21E
MYHTIEEFLGDWSYESSATQKLLDLLTDESLPTRVAEEERKLGFLAWHIVVSVHEMMSRVGLEFDAPHHNAKMPSSAKEIAEEYERASENLSTAMREQWSDADLSKEHDMYGEMWSSAKTLDVLVKHQIHHRGQLTVLMRQVGLAMVGMYGPSREEWKMYGGDVPE